MAATSHSKTPYAFATGGGLLGVIAGPIRVFIGLATARIARRVVTIKESS
jgi:hypothetical protein